MVCLPEERAGEGLRSLQWRRWPRVPPIPSSRVLPRSRGPTRTERDAAACLSSADRSTHPPPMDHPTLQDIAHAAMEQRGLAPEFSAAAQQEAAALAPVAVPDLPALRDLRQLLWCSIDNDDSRDLDQLTVAKSNATGGTTMLVAVADVSAVVALGSPVDAHARANTTSVYTPPQNFPMLPDRLSTDLTSL